MDEANSAAQILSKAQEMMRTLLPWRYPAFENAAVVGNNAFFKGSFTPVVRKPVVQLNSTAAVLGLGDTVILNDPIVGQGGNNASKMANVYAQAIIDRGDAPFDVAWMNRTFDAFWQYSQSVNRFCDIFLAPPAPHVVDILQAASRHPEVASDFVNGFNHPPSLFPWLDDAEAGTIVLLFR